MNGSEYRKPNGRGRCCSRRTQLEKILFVVVGIMIIIAIVLIVLVAKKQSDFIATHCDTQICINEASKISKYVDPSINPCDDFYDFACGKFLKEVHGDEKFGLLTLLNDLAKRQLLEGYMEPVSKEDHKIVQTSKKLFRACMNETEIDAEGLKTIKDALKSVGGWPVVEGIAWREDRFDWLKVTYKLRKLGYNFKIFLDLLVVPDPENSSKNILKISTPDMWDYNTHSFNKIDVMTDIAIKFGAKNRELAQKEMSETNEFLVQLQREIYNRYNIGKPTKYPVDLYQRMCDSLNWLDFINNITAPITKISNNDSVIFPPADTMNSWIKLISLLPKRTQANYMMWKVVETVLPYLTDDLRNKNVHLKSPKAREDFCLHEVQERFIPSPIDIMCDRKYLPKEKKKQVEELLLNVKNELVGELRNLNWMSKEDKDMILERASSINFVVGQPGDYFDNKILNDLGMDLVTVKNNSLLNLIAQADRNRQSILYSHITNSKIKNLYEKQYIQNAAGLPIYSEEDNVIFVPAISTGDLLFQSNRSNYLNYGSLGTQIGLQFSTLLTTPLRGYASPMWSNHTKEEGEKKITCIKTAMQDYNIELTPFTLGFLLQQSIGEQVSYKAYKKWLQNNTEEKKLIGVDYTPNQLFWISAASTFCQPISPYSSLQRAFKDEKLFSTVVSGSIRNIEQFSQDFNCPSKAKMNPSHRCQLI